jgi:hypothetical protein
MSAAAAPDTQSLNRLLNNLIRHQIEEALARSTLLVERGVATPLAVEVVRDALLCAAIAHHRSAAVAGHLPQGDAPIRRAVRRVMELPQVMRSVTPEGRVGPEIKPN